MRISVAPVKRVTALGDEWVGSPWGNGKIRNGPCVGAIR